MRPADMSSNDRPFIASLSRPFNVTHNLKGRSRVFMDVIFKNRGEHSSVAHLLLIFRKEWRAKRLN